MASNPDDEMIEIVRNTSDYFMLEDLTTTEVVQAMTGDNEDFVAAKWKSQMIRRYTTSTEINFDTEIIRGTRATRTIDHG